MTKPVFKEVTFKFNGNAAEKKHITVRNVQRAFEPDFFTGFDEAGKKYKFHITAILKFIDA